MHTIVDKQVYSPELEGPLDLKDPVVAAVLAWLVPGLGHIYQGRTGKGLVFMVCILGTFFYGLLALGEGRVVYASWRPDPVRLPYLCQVGVGLPALPALVQASRMRQGKPPWWGGLMAPPAPERGRRGGMERQPTIHDLHVRLHRYFELATVYTMIAGLLNVLVIYDAWAGPMYVDEASDEPVPPGERGPPQPGGD